MHRLATSDYQGIAGLFSVISSSPGPIVCCSVCTHGGETLGLDVIDTLLRTYALKNILCCGTVIFMLSNVEAYKRYVLGGDFAASRYIDENMNRCATEENIAHGRSYEATRLRELLPVLSQVNYHIDIHSTSQSPVSMAIYTHAAYGFFSENMDVDVHYIGIPDHQVGKPFIDICERRGGMGVGIEVGMQTDPIAYRNGVDNVLRILSYLQMIPHYGSLKGHCENNKIVVFGSIVVDDATTFILKKKYTHGEKVAGGTVIAQQGGNDIVVYKDATIIMPSKHIYSGEEYCFLGE